MGLMATDSVCIVKMMQATHTVNQKEEVHLLGEIDMTRCTYLDAWFDEQSKRVDEAEAESGKCFATGERKK